MPKTLRPANVKKERGHEKRKRLENFRKARQFALNYILPTILVIFAALTVLFFWKYGFGGQGTGSQMAKLRKMMREAKARAESAAAGAGSDNPVAVATSTVDTVKPSVERIRKILDDATVAAADEVVAE